MISVGDLELVMARHWQAPETDWLGGWLLRAAGGFTNRANSVLAVGEPGMPMDVAVLEVTDWYTDRGLRPTAASPEPVPGERDAEQLLAAAAAFEAAGWAALPGAGAVVLTAGTGILYSGTAAGRMVAGDLPGGLELNLAAVPDAGWLAQYHYRGQALPPVAAALLRSAPEQVFVSVRDGVRTIGVARGSLAEGWAGVTAVEVDPEYRRRGVARAMLRTLAGWAGDRGAGRMYVQVGEHNPASRELCLSSGFTPHHRYTYLAPGSAS
jgi:GNAT superfamily N-acetyltransferase